MLDCDLVMKGGITSGVVYPLAICELAKKYRFHQIGGASAGAIAAAMAAAAEYRRRSEGSTAGFDRLAHLPEALGKGHPTQLSRLFVARGARGFALRLLRALVGPGGTFAKCLRALGVLATTRFAIVPLVGVALGALIVAKASSGIEIALSSLAALLLVAGSLAAGLGLALWRAYQAVTVNFGGICDGLALTEWLETEIEQTSGKKLLTFGMLRGFKNEDGTEDKLRRINLAMMTTDLSHGRPFRLPFDDAALVYFDPAELRRVFPKTIVGHLRDTGREKITHDGRELTRWPLAADIPIVIAARMSLSFPILLATVPLYLGDGTQVRRCWFSDGGICSNLPIHFFDALLPRWPTLALDLCQVAEVTGDPAKDVRLGDQRVETWNDIRALSPAALVANMVDTMQNWSDNLLATAPGYSDRIVSTLLTSTEGGLNLDMPSKTITELARRGRAAGDAIGNHFDRTIDQGRKGWNAHLRTRYRAALNMVQEVLGGAHRRYFSDPEPTKELRKLIVEQPIFEAGSTQAEQAELIYKRFLRFHELDGDRFPALVPEFELRPRPRSI